MVDNTRCTMKSTASTRRMFPHLIHTVCFAVLMILLTMMVLETTQEEENPVVQVSVVFRHGEKTPTLALWENDTDSVTESSEDMGQLTLKGKTHLFELGQKLRELYGHLLGEVYRQDTLNVRSSSSNRCLMSAAALLAGLMPPDEQERLRPDLSWQPIPVHYLPSELDDILHLTKPCPRYDVELQKALNSPATQALQKEYSELNQYLSNYSGGIIKGLEGVKNIYDTFICKNWQNQEIPNPADPEQLKKLQYFVAKIRNVYTSNDVLKRFRTGSLLKDISTHMQELANNQHAIGKMFLYSGHEQNIYDVIRSLGFNELFEVHFGSCLIFELHKDKPNLKHFVKVLYYNMMFLSEPKILDVPGCGTSCDLETFVKKVQPLFITDWDKECQST